MYKNKTSTVLLICLDGFLNTEIFQITSSVKKDRKNIARIKMRFPTLVCVYFRYLYDLHSIGIQTLYVLNTIFLCGRKIFIPILQMGN